jgi:hypothetical protein
MSQIKPEEDKETLGSYIGNVILCMLFPIVVLWYGPKYLLNQEYVKGIVIILIVVVELIVLNSIFDIF